MIKYITNRILPLLAFSLFVFCYPTDMKAQKPGNVTVDVDLWLKADNVTGTALTDGASVTTWADRSGSNNNFVQDGNHAVPTYSLTEGMNYNPTLYFRNTTDTYRNLKLVSQNAFVTIAGRNYYTITVSDFSNATDQSNSSQYAPVFSYAGNPTTADVENNARTGWYKSTSSSNLNYLYMGYAANASSSLRNPGLSQRYGVMTTDHTNGNLWHNGVSTSGSGLPVRVNTNVKAVIGKRFQASSAGNYNNNSYGNFVGKISEVIVLSTTGSLSGQDLAKVHSYLAIKYGLTLYSAAGVPVSYYNSQYGVVYDGSSSNTYRYGIFGIGRDDSSGLYQKQSQNIDDKNMIVFAGNTLYPTNSENPNTISTDRVYLMFGHNNVDGMVDYDYRGQTYLSGTGTTATMPQEYTHRQGLVYRARVTGGVAGYPFSTTVSLQRSGVDYIMVSTDADFAPGATRLYKADSSGAVKGLSISDGEYISFLMLTKAPGQISSGLKMWLRADEPSTLTIAGGEVQEWRDFSGNPNNIRYEYNAAAQGTTWTSRPYYREASAYMNYHPTLYMDKIGQFLSTDRGPFDNPRPETYTFISVVNVEEYPTLEDGAQTPYILGFGARTTGTTSTGSGSRYARRPAIGVSKRENTNDGVARYHENTYASSTDARYEKYIYGTYNLFNPAATTITLHEIHLYTPSGGRISNIAEKYILFESDGYPERITSSTTGMSTAMGTSEGVGSSGVDLTGPGMLGIASRPQRQLLGSIGEIIAYERGLTESEKMIIYSYLGIKYGITLDLDKLTHSTVANSKNFDYTLSDNTLIWPGTTDPTADQRYRKYHHNVAGLVRDDEGGFNNMQARSTDQNGIVRIGIGDRMGENPILTGLEYNLESLMWGNDGETGEITFSETDDYICGQMDTRMKRVWMLDNTRTDRDDYVLNISAGGPLASGFFPYFGAGYQVYMLVAETEDAFDPTKTTGPYDWTLIPGTFMNGEHHFNFQFEPGQEYAYFTFGGIPQAGTCDACEAAGAKVLNFTTSTWPNATPGTTSGTWNDLSEITPTVKVEWAPQGNSRWYSRNPRAVTYNSLRMTRQGRTDGIVRITAELEKAAKATFTVYEIDRSGSSYETIEIYGLCGDAALPGATINDGDKFMPKLYYVDTKANSSYEIVKNRAIANKRTSTAFQRRGQMYVEFPYPVEKIVIEQSVNPTNRTDIMRTGLGPITFTCPTPMPPKNEDGLSFQKGAPEDVSLCEEVRYTFKIDNTNCDYKEVDFIDRLDEGMVWKYVSLDDENNERVADGTTTVRIFTQIIDGKERSTLEILNLLVPSGSDLTFFATAAFKMSETVDKTYSNQALITYQLIENDIPIDKELESCDMYKSSFDFCSPTIVRATATGDRAAPVETNMTTTTCYREDGDINVTITVKNPNNVAIPGTLFEVNFDDTFTYKTGTIQATGGLATEITDAKMIDNEEGTPGPGGTKTPGTFYFENLTIAANGEYTISFTMTAPATPPLDDDTGEILPFDIVFGFESDDEDMCLVGALLDANGSASVPYCVDSDRVIFINQHLMHILK